MSTDPFDPLDHRASRARESILRHVGDVEVTGPRSDLDARRLRQRSDRLRARGAAAAVAVLALLGGGALLSVADGPGSPDDGGVDEELAIDDTEGRALLENLPSSPIDGKQSWRLPVGVSPQTGLRDGDLVTIYGRGFEPNDSLGVVHCSSEADTLNAGVDACELGSNGTFSGVQYVSADAEGNVVAEVQIRRFIETPGHGRVDCASAAERCLLGMGAINNYDRSGGVYLQFEGSPNFAAPSLSVSGSEDELTPGQEVQVQVSAWVPGRLIRLQQCATGTDGYDDADPCETLLDTRADEAGSLTAALVLNAAVIVDGREVACTPGCVLRATGIGVPEGTTAPLPDPVPLRFAPGTEGVTTTSHAATTTTTVSVTTTTTTTTITAVPGVAPGSEGDPATTTSVAGTAPESRTAPDPVLPDRGPVPGT
jgi:hypothetical protein